MNYSANFQHFKARKSCSRKVTTNLTDLMFRKNFTTTRQQKQKNTEYTEQARKILTDVQYSGITNKKANDNEGSGIFIKKNENPASTVNTATTTKHFMQPVYVKSLNQSKLILKIPQPTQKPYLEHFRRHQYKLY